MSLQLAANHLAAHGRGPDTTLVHMSRDEVKGLNDLAMAHGGSLSINPQTGLPEAGFLSSLLPMIGGAALSAMGMPPMMASLVMGGITGVSSGSLSKGLMAGLGAYGGAGMMGGLMGAGQGGLAEAGMLATNQVGQIPTLAAGDTAAYAQQIDALRTAQLAKAAEAPFMEQAKAGFSKIGEAPGQFFKDNWKYAAAAAAPVLAAPQTATKQPEIDNSPGKMASEGYQYDPGRVTTPINTDPFAPEQTYFKPRYYKPGYAGGGPIEAMSDANAVGANTGYPMADISKGAYATPYQTPISRNVLSGAADTGVNPMTGEMTFADGGVVPSTTGQGGNFEYDPLTQMFKKIEAMPSDNQVQANQPAQPLPTGGGYSTPMTDAQFAKQMQQGQENMQGISNVIGDGMSAISNKTVAEGLASALTGGLSSAVNAAKNFAINTNIPGTQISLLAPASLAAKAVGEAANVPANLMAFKTSPPNPNPNAVQVVDAGTMVSPSALGDVQAKADANNAQQTQAISAALAGLQGVGPSSPAATSAGVSGIGGIGGAPGAPALGVNSGGGYAVTGDGGTAGVGGTGTAGLHGVGGGGVGGPGVSTGSGSGGGAAAMGTGAHGMAAGAGAARGGLMAAYSNGGSHLGDYSDGGRLLRGPGDGVSDSIPAVIGKKQPARLADGEFVVPARIVSELGNGSTEAGARKLYAMMDRIQKARGKTVGKGKVAKNSRSEKYLPA
jgi:hypothetical protein